MKVGDKIKFKSEKQRYTVVGADDRYLICVKPFNARKTYLYTIVDLVEKIRGPDYWIFGRYDHRVENDIKQCLTDLQSGETEISRRNRIKLDLETV